ncbi:MULTISPECIES: hypothetical protein [Thermomonospora]|uniref:Uncharacterized protein n=1 Tax=Thermomonospora curvata (strain ATCC 19995 / DSM 43183 / JCM 3096 / KCTC 9072 / NBRC 15933 / NCIMB 10081 / Henssen B9) TaxID=471852 RepID=D1A3J5_THECD|nr:MULTISPECIES: hypothetical protein [Thermomonospora]ACY96120.1 hypothetical protein Tcur_0523 [Thermomonospora curvata DSM 43183]PKK15975.1 MAG: hypothetical protein BUE48_002550 [Thermomonospora sp. CIF 1]
MTPFMVAVAQTCQAPDEAGRPRTVPSEPRSVSVGTERQVAVRSLAEQLVCEANAVLADFGEHIVLEDDTGAGVLGFVLSIRDRRAQVRTTYADGVARARLHWSVPGEAEQAGPAIELAGPDDVADLILRLLAGVAGPDARHP